MTTAAVTVRRATVADVDALVELRVALFTEIGRLAPDPGQTEWFRSANRTYLARGLADGSFTAWVAEAGGRIVATSGMVYFPVPPQPENPAGLEAYLMNMYVRPEHRGQGVAAAVLEAVVADVKAGPARRILLLTTPEGRGLYERAGFTCSERTMELTW